MENTKQPPTGIAAAVAPAISTKIAHTGLNFRKAKIVAKIADNKSEIPFLVSLFESGADVAWLNTAHQDEPGTLEVMKRIRSVTTRIPIMIDTKGPEIRTKDIETPIPVKVGDSIILTGDLKYVGANVVHVTYPNFHNEVPVGKSVLYDDASLEMVVEEKVKNGLRCVVKSNGQIKNKKSLNIPGVHIHLPALSEKDKSFIHFCAKNNVDFIAHSFVRNKEDLFEIKDILKDYPEYKGKIISKIENREGFDNIREILEHSDGIMVARGDLGAEVPLEEMTYMQKKMVAAALQAGKYSMVATQVLDSMIKNPRPTRAEVTDITNAILDGSGATTMSGETAYGDYPFEATATMARVQKYAEGVKNELNYLSMAPMVKSKAFKFARKAVAKATKKGASAVIVLANNMDIVRALAAYRPSCVIVPVCTSEGDARELMMAYAVRPVVSTTLTAEAALKEINTSSDKVSGPIFVITEKNPTSWKMKTL